MLYVTSDRPVDPIAVSVMRAVDAVAKDLHLSYFLVGAMARDVLLGHVFGLNPGRATRDMDVAFALQDWEQFQQIRDRLIADGGFVVVRDVAHRLLFSPDGDTQSYIVDLIPFGGVEQPTHTIAWPPDMHTIMHVTGFSEALQTAPLVQVATGFTVHVASLPGLALLKLFAWQDRGLEDSRDAIDLVTLCRHYAEAGNLDRIYDEAMLALEAVGFDIELAGAWLLGMDTAVTAAPQTRVRLRALLGDARVSERLGNDMAKALRSSENAVQYTAQLLDQFTQGFSSQTVV
jgi:predicted nucleotidyltransferase